MPEETESAVEYALKQKWVDEITGEEFSITKDMVTEVVDYVRKYFNDNNIEYSSYSYSDLVPFL